MTQLPFSLVIHMCIETCTNPTTLFRPTSSKFIFIMNRRCHLAFSQSPQPSWKLALCPHLIPFAMTGATTTISSPSVSSVSNPRLSTFHNRKLFNGVFPNCYKFVAHLSSSLKITPVWIRKDKGWWFALLRAASLQIEIVNNRDVTLTSLCMRIE